MIRHLKRVALPIVIAVLVVLGREARSQDCRICEGAEIIAISGVWRAPHEEVDYATCSAGVIWDEIPVSCSALQNMRTGVWLTPGQGTVQDLYGWLDGDGNCQIYGGQGGTYGELFCSFRLAVSEEFWLRAWDPRCEWDGYWSYPPRLCDNFPIYPTVTRISGGPVETEPVQSECGGLNRLSGASYRLKPGTYQITLSASTAISGNPGPCFGRYPAVCLQLLKRERILPDASASIQAAIDAVPEGESGWTIRVPEGVYAERIDFKGKRITIEALGDQASTILDGTRLDGEVVRATSGETAASVLSGFTIRNGVTGASSNGRRVGGGVFVRQSSPTIRNCALVANSAQAGGGLALVESEALIESCTFTLNGADTGGAIWIEGGHPEIKDCVITANSASGHGGGVSRTEILGRPPHLVGNTVCGNSSADVGRPNVWALFEDGGNRICDCLTDVDGSGETDTADLSLLLLFMGESTSLDFIQPDQDMNGIVDTGDVSLLLLNFGPCT